MKKVLMISALVMMIVVSMVSGTLALYTTTLADPIEGSVVAKKFVLVGEGVENFTADVKIAPEDTKDLTFTVTNTSESIPSEVKMSVDITLTFAGIEPGQQIKPLTVAVYEDVSGTETLLTLSTTPAITGALSTVVGSDFGTGTLTINDVILFAGEDTTKTYIVRFTWLDGGLGDIAFAGKDYGTKLTVTADGDQV